MKVGLQYPFIILLGLGALSCGDRYQSEIIPQPVPVEERGFLDWCFAKANGDLITEETYRTVRILVQSVYLDQINVKTCRLAFQRLLNKKEIALYPFDIRDIRPLRNLVNLEELDLGNNPVRDLKPLRRLKALRVLRARSLGSLKGVRSLSNLRTLEVSLFSLDGIERLAELPHLTEIYFEIEATIQPSELYRHLSGVSSLKQLELRCNKANYCDGNAAEAKEAFQAWESEKLSNLQHLLFYSFRIYDLGPLKGLRKLDTLGLKRIPLNDVSSLTGLPNLKAIELHDTFVTDLSPLSSLHTLETLQAKENKLKTVSRLPPRLKSLDISGNRISEISIPQTVPLNTLKIDAYEETKLDSIFELDSLTELQLYGKYGFSPISKLSRLKRLQVNLGHILDLTPEQARQLSALESLTLEFSYPKTVRAVQKACAVLTSLPHLQELTFNHISLDFPQALSGLGCLKNHPRLKSLSLTHCYLSDVAPLKEFTKLEYLDLSENRIKDISPLLALPRLTVLNASKNNLEETVVLSPNLQKADVSGNTIEVLKIKRNAESNLRELTTGLFLKDLEFLRSMRKLEYLYLGSSSHIKDFSPISTLTTLEKLNLSLRQIEDIGFLRPLRNIEWLDLSGNQVKDISVLSQLPKLKYVDLRNAQPWGSW